MRYHHGMKILLRAVVTGFGLSVGAALYKKLSKEFGWDDKAKPDEVNATTRGTGEAQPLHS
jgi:hypothetical protein